MRYTYRGALQVLVAGLCLLTAVNTGCRQEAGPSWVCRITSVQGDVKVHRTGQAAGVLAALGTELAAGDKVLTGDASAAVLQFADFATVALNAASEFSVKEQKRVGEKGLVQITTDLAKGMGLVKVVKNKVQGFEVRTPHVVTGVLGTMFGLEVKPEETVLAVAEGKVFFRNLDGGEITVESMDGARCDGHIPPGLIKQYLKIQSLLASALTNFVAEDAKGGSGAEPSYIRVFGAATAPTPPSQ